VVSFFGDELPLAPGAKFGRNCPFAATHHRLSHRLSRVASGHSFPTIGWPRCAWVTGVSSLHGYDAPRDLALGNSKALQVGDSSYRKVVWYISNQNEGSAI